MAACIAGTALFPLFIGPVPITLQDCLVIGSGIFLGPKEGTKAVGLYIVAGGIGLPVFSGGRSGIAHVLGPTGGYLAGFMLLAFFAGFAAQYRGQRELSATHFWSRLLAGCVAGYVSLYTTGTLWLAHTLDVSLVTAFTVGVLPFLPVTVIKLLVLFASLHTFYPQIIRFSPYGTSLTPR